MKGVKNFQLDGVIILKIVVAEGRMNPYEKAIHNSI